MKPYAALDQAGMIWFGIMGMILLTAAVCLLTVSRLLRMNRRCRGISLVLTILAAVCFQGMADVERHKEVEVSMAVLGRLIGGCPWGILLGILFCLAAGELWGLFYLQSRRRSMMTPEAVKESLDALPDGVCFSTAAGTPVLVNVQMNRLSSELFGKTVLHTGQAWECLQNGQVNPGVRMIQTGETVTVQTGNRTVWDFRRTILKPEETHAERQNLQRKRKREKQTEEADRPCIQEIMAVDVTEQYRLNQELEERNRRLEAVGERLRRFSREMEQVTREREILEAKIRVHDEVGRSLLALRTYLERPEQERNRNELLPLWRYVVTVLSAEDTAKKRETEAYRKSEGEHAQPPAFSEVQNSMRSFEQEWTACMQDAAAVGVTLHVSGEFPKEEENRRLIFLALRECISNTAKHAGGRTLFLSLDGTENTGTEEGKNAAAVGTAGEIITAVFRNDGEKPAEPILERGGLKNLRCVVEQAGGTMTVESCPEFLLRLELPKGEGNV